MTPSYKYFYDNVDKLPSELAIAVLDFDFVDAFSVLCESHRLDDNQGEILENLTFRLMFGEISASEFTSRLVSEGRLTPEQAHSLTIDTQNNLVLKVKELFEAKIAEIESEYEEDADVPSNKEGAPTPEHAEIAEKTEYAEPEEIEPEKQPQPIKINRIAHDKYMEPIDNDANVGPIAEKSTPIAINRKYENRVETNPETKVDAKPDPVVRQEPTKIPTSIKPIPTIVEAPKPTLTEPTQTDASDQGFVEPKFKKYADLMGNQPEKPPQNPPVPVKPQSAPTKPTAPSTPEPFDIHKKQDFRKPDPNKPANIIRSAKLKGYSQVMTELFGRAFQNTDPINQTAPQESQNTSKPTDPITQKTSTVTVSKPSQTYLAKDPYKE